MIKKKGLGRGLSALLSDTPETNRLEEAPAPSGTMSEIAISEIEVNPYQRQVVGNREFKYFQCLNRRTVIVNIH